MGTAFRDIVLRLTEASLTADQVTPEEAAALFAEAARTIEDLRDRHCEERALREPLGDDFAYPAGRSTARSDGEI